MSDGAHLGVKADRALGTILGGEDQPTEDEKQTPEQMLDEIRSASKAPNDYGECALAYARVLLEAYETHPALRDHPTESVYLNGQDGKAVFSPDGGLVRLVPDIYEVLKRLHPDEECWQQKVMNELTGFMVGWAVNAVRYALGDPPRPNPAMVEIG